MRLRAENVTSETKDNTGVNSIFIQCSNGEYLHSNTGKGWGEDWIYVEIKNEIVDPITNPVNVIDTVWVRSVNKLGCGDDTAINGLRFEDMHGNMYMPGKRVKLIT